MSDEKKTDPDLEHDDWTELGGEDASRLLKGIEAIIPGILRKSIVHALSEEGLRGVVTEKNIPKEAVGFVLSQADSTRKEILRIVSREIRTFLENMDFGGEIAKILTTLSFEIRTEVRFIPNEEAVKPNIRNRVKVKRTREDGTTETVNEFDQTTTGQDIPTPKTQKPEPKPAKPEPARPEPGKRRWTRRRSSTDET